MVNKLNKEWIEENMFPCFKKHSIYTHNSNNRCHGNFLTDTTCYGRQGFYNSCFTNGANLCEKKNLEKKLEKEKN
eukprot:Pgem_evm1s5139